MSLVSQGHLAIPHAGSRRLHLAGGRVDYRHQPFSFQSEEDLPVLGFHEQVTRSLNPLRSEQLDGTLAPAQLVENLLAYPLGRCPEKGRLTTRVVIVKKLERACFATIRRQSPHHIFHDREGTRMV